VVSLGGLAVSFLGREVSDPAVVASPVGRSR
jgi:hypothetical protein